MSQENERFATEFGAAFNDRDIDSLADRACHHCVIVALRSALEGPYLGREGVRRWAESYIEGIPDVQLELERVASIDADRVLVLGRQGGAGHKEGPSFDAPLAAVMEFEDGLLARLTAYTSHSEALEAAGMPAQTQT